MITFACIFFYFVVTFAITNWRKRFRRVQNSLESVSADIAVDSLLNFETVKRFFFFFLEDEFFSEVFIAVSLLKIMKLSAMTCLCAS